jgi:hypothetical protein
MSCKEQSRRQFLQQGGCRLFALAAHHAAAWAAAAMEV